MTDARQAAIELMKRAEQAAEDAIRSGQGYAPIAEWELDALLSDEGRPLLAALLRPEGDPPVYEWMVEYLKERGVLVPMTSDPNPGDTPEPWAVRLPSEENAK